jgi:MoxR-like ATPase
MKRRWILSLQANDGILNSLLMALNERRYTNEGQTIDIPVISFMSASNEIPNFNDPAEKILRPLYDRFEIKVVTQYVEDRSTRLDMLRRKQVVARGNVFSSIALDELEQMQEEVRLLDIPDSINELMDDLLCELRKAGVHISDRKYFNYYPLAQAKAWLDGCSEVNALHLLALKNYLWTTPEEIIVIEQILTRMCQNPLKDKLDNLRAMAVDSLDQLKADKDNKKAMIKFRGEFIRLYDMVRDLLSKAGSSSETKQIGDFEYALEDMSREAHDIMGFTYANLGELKALQ